MDRAPALEAALAAFVAAHAHRPRQRSAAWVAARQLAVGGSEVAALMGRSRYASFADVVASKAGLAGFGGGPATRWGTFFEEVAEKVLALDLGVEVHGTDISVPAPPGSGLETSHANSPDGYCVVGLSAAHGEERLAAVAGTAAGRAAVALLEFKCPHRRRPTGTVPRHYLPQLWSGLAVAPLAEFAIYVDAVFRKCPSAAFGPSPEVDAAYHGEAPGRYGGAVAWGVAAFYAPAGGLGDGEALAGPSAGVVDLGAAAAEVFDGALRLLEEKRLCARHAPPHLAGRPGGPFPEGRGLETAAPPPPPGYELWGLLPWKLLELHYVPVAPRPGFLEEVRPLIQEALGAASRIRAAPEPKAAYEAFVAARREAGRPSADEEQALVALFDKKPPPPGGSLHAPVSDGFARRLGRRADADQLAGLPSDPDDGGVRGRDAAEGVFPV